MVFLYITINFQLVIALEAIGFDAESGHFERDLMTIQSLSFYSITLSKERTHFLKFIAG